MNRIELGTLYDPKQTYKRSRYYLDESLLIVVNEEQSNSNPLVWRYIISRSFPISQLSEVIKIFQQAEKLACMM